VNCPVITALVNLATAKSSLARQLRQLFASDWLTGSSSGVIRLEVPLSDCSPLEWLSWQPHSPQLYWSDRQLDFEMAGIGCADKIKCDRGSDYSQALQEIRRNLSNHAGKARYYGGARFNPGVEADPDWSPYGNGFFMLPQFEVFADATGTCFACNIRIDAHEGLGQKLRFLLRALEKVCMESPLMESHEKTPSVFRRDIPEKEEWFGNVESALTVVGSGEVDKIVLGRSTVLLFDTAPNAASLLKRLKAVEPFAYHFYIQPERGYAFLGATPERLYKRQQDMIHSEALAGTCSRGATFAEDKALGEFLLCSEKEYREHIIVRDAIKSLLETHCRYLEVSDELRLLKQSKVQHLHSQIKGRLLENISDSDLLKLLHPTPAVGGLPRSRALQEIARLERFDRGWFAGPVGWLGHDAAEFAVGIRSAIIYGQSLRLFAGAGIVEGSVPAREWEEVETKISVFMDILGIP
jgi:menaquinone-specific isochorismate synthase